MAIDLTQIGVIITFVLGLLVTYFGNEKMGKMKKVIGDILTALIAVVTDITPVLTDLGRGIAVLQMVQAGIIEVMKHLAELKDAADAETRQKAFDEMLKDLETLANTNDTSALTSLKEDLLKICSDLQTLLNAIEEVWSVPADMKANLRVTADTCCGKPQQ